MTATRELRLPSTSAAPRLARGALRDWLGPDSDADELRSAQLLVSELVTNAVVHGQGTITLKVLTSDQHLLVEVIDQGHGFEREVRQQDFDTIGGQGLHIVDQLASRWGIHEGTTHVWFELERPGPRLAPPQPPPT